MLPCPEKMVGMSEEEAEYFVYLHNKQLDGYMDMKFND